jgi:hypothetical protein
LVGENTCASSINPLRRRPRAIDAKGAVLPAAAALRGTFKRQALLPMRTKFLFVVSMDVDPVKEDLFNEVYDTVHMPTPLSRSPVYAGRCAWRENRLP